LRTAISQVCSMGWSFDRDMAWYAEIGAPAISILGSKLEAFGREAGLRLLSRSGLAVAAYGSLGPFSLHEPEAWPAEIQRAGEQIALAAGLGARTATLLSGSGRGRPYPESEAALVALLEQLLPLAERHGVVLALEHNHALRVDLGFVHSLHDALDLADRVDSPWFSICCEINNAWIERFLYEDIRARVGRIGLVQLSDFLAGTLSTPERAPLGDGIIPLEPILRAFEAARYPGWYEIELIGREIERLGYEESIRRSLAFLARLGSRGT
jgi:sugar phosphate isomerase/epimerase